MGLVLALVLATQTVAGSPTLEISGKDGAKTTIDQAQDPLDDKLIEGFRAIKAAKPDQALRVAEEIIIAEEQRFAGEKRLINAARSLDEAVLYAGLAGTQHKSSIVLGSTWADAYFLKGFALIDLGRGDEARPWLDKAVALSPMNAQYLAERGEWFKNRKDWDRSFADFEEASAAAEFSPADSKSFERRRALRGMAYVRVEQARFAEARPYIQECLKLEATDTSCKNELQFIDEQQPKGR